MDRDQDGLADALEVRLVEQFRPFWFVDQSETVRPISVTDWARLGVFNLSGDGHVAYADLPSLLAAVQTHPTGTLHLSEGPIRGRDGATIYVDALPMPADYAISGKRNLVWLHFWLLFGDDVKPYSPSRSHRGDWEHVCVMVERNAVGDRDRPPVMIHWHHHGHVDVAAEAHAWHEDAAGGRHPRAYIEAGGHGIYRVPGTFPGEHDDGAGSTDDPLDDPVVFMQDHGDQSGDVQLEATIVNRFMGRWGQTVTQVAASPEGPLVHNGVCDHDYTPHPTASSFALDSCAGL